ncbi:hypothetical protein Dimus_015275 [Dionaea muscipula]
MSEYNIGQLVQEAQARWLKPAEILFILQRHESYQISQEAPQKPPSGSLFLFNRRVLRFFRKDGYSWRKKKDGKTAGEAHERLKVGNIEALNCYYAHGEHNPSFQRRSYWMLDSAYDHIVLVHYREITDQNKFIPGSISEQSSGPSSVFTSSPSSYTVQNPGSISLIHMQESNQSLSSPGSTEVSSELAGKHHGVDHFDCVESVGNVRHSSPVEVSQALRRLEEQLSLDEDVFEDCLPIPTSDEPVVGHGVLHYDGKNVQDQAADSQPYDYYRSHTGCISNSTNSASQQGDGGFNQHPSLGLVHGVSNGEYLSWNYALGISDASRPLLFEGNGAYMIHANQEKQLSTSSGHGDAIENLHLWKFGGNETNQSLTGLPEKATDIVPAYSSAGTILETDQDFGAMFDRGQFGMYLEADSRLVITQEQKFKIHEISPEWGFAGEATKVIILGSFLCQPSDYNWSCMFGDTEVPVQIIQDGALCCQAPPCLPGKVTLCITSGNQQSCSEIREFEYRDKTSICPHCNRSEGKATKSAEELLLLVRFVQLLLSNSSVTREGDDLGIDRLKQLKTDEDLWDQLIDDLLSGSGTVSSTSDWLLLELLKDKLQDWISYRTSVCSNSGCTMSKKEQGIIHMIAGLGYEWALNPVLDSGVGINFRDLNGWTALHWAARFGREKMVAALVASGASPGAVTDPYSQDPRGRTPASIAAAYGHQGLAGYLSELALTSHLSSLALQESELSGCSADVEAEEVTVNNVSKNTATTAEDQIHLKQTLAAVRNASQAAARIQAAFRARSFRRRREREIAALAARDEYGFGPSDISAASKLVFRNRHDHNAAALSIQKNYKGWKGRKDFLAIRQKVVKIQAHVRGYQVRKQYKVICWAVGIVEKVVLRWRRKGAGLRGFKADPEIDEDVEYEDLLKVFRKQNVEAAIDESVSRVLSMVECPQARQQYQRVLERYREAKVCMCYMFCCSAMSLPIMI